jgi:hypothetical protein
MDSEVTEAIAVEQLLLIRRSEDRDRPRELAWIERRLRAPGVAASV